MAFVFIFTITVCLLFFFIVFSSLVIHNSSTLPFIVIAIVYTYIVGIIVVFFFSVGIEVVQVVCFFSTFSLDGGHVTCSENVWLFVVCI
ncbi:hypothetical protein D3C80_2069540 [compost metagenome]